MERWKITGEALVWMCVLDAMLQWDPRYTTQHRDYLYVYDRDFWLSEEARGEEDLYCPFPISESFYYVLMGKLLKSREQVRKATGSAREKSFDKCYFWTESLIMWWCYRMVYEYFWVFCVVRLNKRQVGAHLPWKPYRYGMAIMIFEALGLGNKDIRMYLRNRKDVRTGESKIRWAQPAKPMFFLKYKSKFTSAMQNWLKSVFPCNMFTLTRNNMGRVSEIIFGDTPESNGWPKEFIDLVLTYTKKPQGVFNRNRFDWDEMLKRGPLPRVRVRSNIPPSATQVSTRAPDSAAEAMKD